MLNKLSNPGIQCGPYTGDFLHTPWKKAPMYQKLTKLFLFHPAYSAPFIETVNQYHYHPVLTAWRSTQDISYFEKRGAQ